ncbi:MAG: type IV secretion system DNA-binding domain-containing protein [Chloroflexota bacterium]
MATQAIHLLRAAGESLTLPAISRVINGAPNHPLELKEEDVEQRVVPQLLRQADERGSPQLDALCDYWLGQFPNMNERTRGDVISTLTTVLFRFSEPPFDDLVASTRGSSYMPEMVDAGRVMILDCPVINYQLAGRLFQIAMKHLVQQAILRRPTVDTTRPVAIIADEAQNFVTHADYAYQAMCRDFRGCTVYATQTLDNYKEAVGSEAAVEALLASLVTKIFHANAGRTNEWAQKLIAGDWRTMHSDSLNQRGGEGKSTMGLTQSESIQPQVLASEFTRLRNGGSRNGGLVDGIVFQPGRLFRQTGKPHLRVTFAQCGR